MIPSPSPVFGAEKLRVTVSVTVAVGFPIGFPVPVPHPLADGFSDPLPLGDRYYPAAADDPAAYHDAAKVKPEVLPAAAVLATRE